MSSSYFLNQNQLDYTCRSILIKFLHGSSSSPPPLKKIIIKRPLINNKIRAFKVRVIDETGKQLGVIDLNTALQTAKERALDLVQVTEKVVPPVCKIMDSGKYLYQREKKERGVKLKAGKAGEMKQIRLTFNISEHDMETRAIQAEKFLKKGDKVRIEMRLRGRENALKNFAKEKINKFLENLEKRIPFKVERELKELGKRLTIIIAPK